LLSSNLSLSISGRRTLEAYLLLFLQGLPVAAEHDHARIADRVLNTHSLGEHVAPRWRLLDVMRWVPPRAGQPGLDGRAAGQYKVAGTTVEAIVGGILHQFVRLLGFFSLKKLELTNELGWKHRSQAVPHTCASALITSRHAIRAAGRSSCRRAEGS
jgi:hypothetical protein